ncbi:hypothetical protein ACWCXX_24915 [Streptomyces sp. NPDC001732]
MTTRYGTWSSLIDTHATGPDVEVLDYVGGEPEWRDLLEKSGALDAIKRAYRTAIDNALPADVALCGDEFIGPREPEDGEFDGYPVDEYGHLDIAACVEGIDLEEIVDHYEPLTLEEIGCDELKSTAKQPAKAAAVVMGRLKVKAFYHGPNPDSGRLQSYYLAGEVRAALAARPGSGNRTPRTGKAAA